MYMAGGNHGRGVHGGGMQGRGHAWPGRHVWLGGMYSRGGVTGGHAWGLCMAGGMSARELPWQGGVHGWGWPGHAWPGSLYGWEHV